MERRDPGLALYAFEQVDQFATLFVFERAKRFVEAAKARPK